MRLILLAPDPVAKAVALVPVTRQARWMLAQPRAVRRSYVEEVVDRRDDPNAQERWMLLQSRRVRASYVKEVLDA
jgi:hypothetical protein